MPSPYTPGYSSFLSNLEEVKLLRKMASDKERLDPIGLREEINVLCRGAIVLLCSHLEAYIKNLGERALDSLHSKRIPRTKLVPNFYYHISKNFIEEIKDTTDNPTIADKVFEFLGSDYDFWSRTGPFPQPIPSERFNKGFSTPTHDKTRAYFNRFGYLSYNGDLARILKADYATITNMVDHLVATRNAIAHGDPTATKTPAEVKDMAAMIQKYCSKTDNVFAAWWGAHFCAIR